MIGNGSAENRSAQPYLPQLCPVAEALAQLSRAGPESRGAVFTRREVVEFILDLVGYTIDRPLWRHSLLEPSCGDGDFVLPVVERLLASWGQQGRPVPVSHLTGCVRAIELHQVTCEETRSRVSQALLSAGISEADAAALSDCWVVHGDFLLTDLPSRYEFVVGNPPYVRQERLPDALVSEYRARYDTVFDRADLYVPFIERSAQLLSSKGKLGIICADRWMKNRYGGPLRRLLSEQFQLHVYVDMVDTPAFHSDVIAYPAEIPASEIPVRFPAWRGRRRRIQAESGRAGTSGGVPAGKRDVSRVCPGAVRSGVQARPGAPPRGGDRPDGPATARATAACPWVRAGWRVRQSGIGKPGKHYRVLSRRYFSRPLAPARRRTPCRRRPRSGR